MAEHVVGWTCDVCGRFVAGRHNHRHHDCRSPLPAGYLAARARNRSYLQQHQPERRPAS